MAKKARKSPIWALVVIVAGALLAVAGGGGAVASQVLAARYAGAVQTEDLFGDAVSEEEARSDIKGPLNFLLVGIDPRKPETPPLADSIMVVHVPASLDKAYIFSVPRDTYVEIPAFAKAGTQAQGGKVNGAMSLGSKVPGQKLPSAIQGFELLSKTVSQLTGIRKFDAGAIINFDGFKKVVDAMGGIDLYVDERTRSEHLAPDGSERPYRPRFKGDEHPYVGPQKVYEVGNRHMKGWEALDFARQRYGLKGTDYGRQRHQQQVLKAIAKKAGSSDVVANPVKLDKVLTAGGKSLTFNGRGRSVLDYAFALKGMRPENITTIKLVGGRFPVSGDYLGEKLTPASEGLFEAMRAETIDEYLLTHPEFINTK
jgi:polyisoprenyl-teichoic acid--peptidoglycan teichoic acid transferase